MTSGDSRGERRPSGEAAHYPVPGGAIPAPRLVPTLLAGLLAACSGGPPPRPTPLPTTPRVDAATIRANEITLHAIGLVGTPYRYGGNTPDGGFDCSGLVGYVYRDAGAITLPRTVADMARMPAERVRRGALRTGDLVFFGDAAQASHVGIYVGEGRFVHAPNEGGTVRLDALDNAYWARRFLFARRIFE